ncbi:hypothetical protein HPB50_011812 [Hyalomma asiaticum]|uniref:Uncharacterized protein n=1 Tax=Hyalomma asiaticum TaxID=266040 RepID=A0ACB7RYD4_HYAAI|nr:hypothetical protein HPB50_011812 [Hyalomma asiaticum]
MDYGFESLLPRHFQAADGLHPSFSGVALMAQTLKTVLRRGKMETVSGWSKLLRPEVHLRQFGSQKQTSAGIPHPSSETQRATIQDTVRSQDSGAKTTRTDTGYPTIAESLTPRPYHQQNTTGRCYNLCISTMPSPHPK